MSRAGQALKSVKEQLESYLGTSYEVKYWYPNANDKDPLERLANNAAISSVPTVYLTNMDSQFAYSDRSVQGAAGYTRESVPLQNNYINLIIFISQSNYEPDPFALLDFEEKIEGALLGFTVSDADVPLRFENTVRHGLAYGQNFWLMSTIRTNWLKPLMGDIVSD